MHGREQYFSLGAFDPAYLQTCQVFVVKASDDQVVAFATFMKEYQRDEITIDLMRHRIGTENGLMDFLFLNLIESARAEGHATFNFGLSPLSGVGEEPEDRLIEKALKFILDNLNQFYNFRGLHDFKAKFLPTWEPRYLVFPNFSSLPAIGLALVHAQTETLTSFDQNQQRILLDRFAGLSLDETAAAHSRWTQARLKLVEATQITLRNLLGLLGITAPKSM